MCPTCKSVLIDVCGKVNCRNEAGQKLCMILAACHLEALKVSEVYSSNDNDDDSLNHSSNFSVTSDMLGSIDLVNELPFTVNSAKVFLVALWLKVSEKIQESKIIG